MRSDTGLMIVGVILGTLLGVLLSVAGYAAWGITPVDVYTEVCTDVFNAEYVSDLSACIDGDKIVHRFGESE